MINSLKNLSSSEGRALKGCRAETWPARSEVPTASAKRVFSVDVEDYFHVSAFENKIHHSTWCDREIRVEQSLMRLLELLDRHDTKATFFVLGWLADKFPGLVQEISARDHEIGSHSHWHRQIHQLDSREFRKDVIRSKSVLESIIQKPVTAFRAPTFSMVEKTFWAFEILVEEGFTVDSSIFPTPYVRNGMAGFSPEIQSIQTPSGSITEFPMPVVRLLGKMIPAGGGGFFRLYPYWLTRRFVQQLTAEGRPFMFYTHPWELDHDQPRVSGIPISQSFRHYVNLKSTFAKIDQLLTDFQFTTMRECLTNWNDSTQLQSA